MNKYLLLVIITVLPFSSSCNRKTPEEKLYYVFNEPENVLPYWQQDYRCGTWIAAEDGEDIKDMNKYVEWGVNEILFGFAMCDHCDSIKIMNFTEKRQRIIYPLKNSKTCSHKWSRSISPYSMDILEVKDYIAIVYKKEIYLIKTISLAEGDMLKYDIAKIPEEAMLSPTTINLKKLKWSKFQAKNQIEISDRFINYYICVEGIATHYLLAIRYDYYYGYSLSDIPIENAAHIAIIKKGQLSNPDIIELTKFRFKTWEDGLGTLTGR